MSIDPYHVATGTLGLSDVLSLPFKDVGNEYKILDLGNMPAPMVSGERLIIRGTDHGPFERHILLAQAEDRCKLALEQQAGLTGCLIAVLRAQNIRLDDNVVVEFKDDQSMVVNRNTIGKYEPSPVALIGARMLCTGLKVNFDNREVPPSTPHGNVLHVSGNCVIAGENFPFLYVEYVKDVGFGEFHLMGTYGSYTVRVKRPELRVNENMQLF